MNIFYIYHSGFAIETENYKLIFDFYSDFQQQEKSSKEIFEIEKFLLGEKKVFVFSSHSHYDHFDREIFQWKNINSNIEYILSEDIKEEFENVPEFLKYFVKEGDNLNIDNIDIKVFGSTDLGVSFFVKCDEKTFFHSGDLNWWYWADDTKEEEEYMRNLYFEKMNLIESSLKNEKIDFLFYPVDPRLEEFSFLGIEYFIQKIPVKTIVPMHMMNNYKIISALQEKIKNIPILKFSEERSLIFSK